MDPVVALNEIAFWLERELAPTFKVKAFRSAAATIGEYTREELAARSRDGRLARTKGIGDRTLQVIEQALAGDVPEYLADLREHGAGPLAEGGKKIGALLRGDLHSHTDWSDGGSPIELMVQAAGALGREYLAITDHSPTLKIAHGLSEERLAAQLDRLAQLEEAQHGENTASAGAGSGGASHGTVRVLSGIEVDILENGKLDQSARMLSRLDVVVASVHSKLRAESGVMTRRMLGGIRDPHTNILGHCTGRLVKGSRGTRPQSAFDAKRVFAACAENNVAVEINSRPERQDPPDDLIKIALDLGCLFSIDSDAHAPGQLDFLQYGAARAAANGVPAERIITTWPLEKLLDWTRAT